MSFTFTVPDEDAEEFRKWRKEHNKTCDSIDVGAIGGRFTWSFTQTGLGCVVKVKCACGQETDFSHFEDW